MCFKTPKYNVQKVEPKDIVPPPIPVAAQPAGVQFGDNVSRGKGEDSEETEDSKNSENKGRIELDEDAKKSLKKKPTTTVSKPQLSTGIASTRRTKSIKDTLGGYR